MQSRRRRWLSRQRPTIWPVTVGQRANVVRRPTADCQFRSRSYLLLGTARSAAAPKAARAKRIPAPIKGRRNDRPLMVNLLFPVFYRLLHMFGWTGAVKHLM